MLGDLLPARYRSTLQGLLSRKFLLALGTALTAASQDQWDIVLTVVLAYLGVEGTADLVARTKHQP
jgi:hypothetical protein